MASVGGAHVAQGACINGGKLEANTNCSVACDSDSVLADGSNPVAYLCNGVGAISKNPALSVTCTPRMSHSLVRMEMICKT